MLLVAIVPWFREAKLETILRRKWLKVFPSLSLENVKFLLSGRRFEGSRGMELICGTLLLVDWRLEDGRYDYSSITFCFFLSFPRLSLTFTP